MDEILHHYLRTDLYIPGGCLGFLPPTVCEFPRGYHFQVGRFNPSKKHARQIGSFPQVGLKINKANNI